MSITDEFRDLLAREFESAAEDGKDYVVIRSGDLHDKLGRYFGADHRMPACCNAMWAAKGNDDEVLESPQRCQGRNLVIRYTIPR